MKYFLLFLPFVFLSSPKYGPEYNSERIKRGIPIIEKSWKLTQSVQQVYSNQILSYITWTTKKTFKTNLPFHQLKVIISAHDSIKEEWDYFIQPINKKMDYELEMKYNYDLNKWDIFFNQNDFSYLEKKIMCESKLTRAITLPQADSVLASWGLSRTGKEGR